MKLATVLLVIGLSLLALALSGCGGTGGLTHYGAYYGPPHSYGFHDYGHPVYIGIPDPGPDLGEPVAVPLPMDID